MIQRAREIFKMFVSLPIVGDVLDIGSEDGGHTRYMKQDVGLNVVSLDMSSPLADIRVKWPADLGRKFGAIWCSHTLEHSKNPGLFLDACKNSLMKNGWLAITVPIRKDQIVGGHLTLWNAGLLLYNLIIAGFDCSKAMVKTDGNDIGVIVRNVDAILPELTYDHGDIEKLAKFFPMEVSDGFDGVIKEINWTTIR
jgi:SAM-dependent methyltransferase